MRYGMRGYGIYFGVIELLMEANSYQLPKNWQAIAYDLREDASEIEDIVLNYQLFHINGTTFWSDSLKERMKKREEVSRSRSESGKKGAVVRKSRRPQKINPTKEDIEKFDKVWNQYPPPAIGKKNALTAYVASVKTLDDELGIVKALSNYKASKRVSDGFLLNGDTWFRQWRDWLNIKNNETMEGIPTEWTTNSHRR